MIDQRGKVNPTIHRGTGAGTDKASKIDPVFSRGMLAALPNLRAFAISLCGNTDQADDLVQDTVVKAWDHADRFQEGSNLRAWLFTILRNTYFSHYRKRRREFEDKDGARAAELVALPSQQAHVDLEDFRRALETLPIEQREALILVGAAGFSYEEAAEICKCAVGTLKSRVNRARVRLSRMLAIASSSDFGAGGVLDAVVTPARIGRLG